MRRASVTVRFKNGRGDPVEVDGWEFEVYGLPFVAHRTVPEQKKGNGWTVTEPKSGAAIERYGSRRTMKAAIEAATERLQKAGKSEIVKAIRKMRAAA